MIGKLKCMLFGHKKRKRTAPTVLECPRCGHKKTAKPK